MSVGNIIFNIWCSLVKSIGILWLYFSQSIELKMLWFSLSYRLHKLFMLKGCRLIQVEKKTFPRVAFDTFGCTWPNTLKHFWCNILSSFTKCYATVWAETWSWIQLISNLLLPCYYTNNCILIIFYSTYPMISPLITWSCYTL